MCTSRGRANQRASLIAAAMLLGPLASLPGETTEFERDVAPLFIQHCIDCHQPNKRSGGLAITTRELLQAGGDQGPALVAGSPEASLLVERVVSGEMPPAEAKSRLTDAEIRTLREWITAGAAWPSGRELGIHEKSIDLDRAREFWSFRQVQRPEPQAVGQPRETANAIDAFVSRELASHEIAANPRAEPRDLLRRLSLDLRGLPPSLDEQRAYLEDTAPGKYERLVDQFLNDPSHGERWARYWLDLVRYADSNGYERDSAKPSVWRYRDYVIRSLNEDLPYDRFVVEQLAGDELPEFSEDGLVAMGFHALGTWQDEVDPLEAAQYRADEIDDLVRTTGQALLGITIGCARCHPHKFDPFSMVDYYRLAAILAPL
jgi:mono/diheme cytochrome c family protein